MNTNSEKHRLVPKGITFPLFFSLLSFYLGGSQQHDRYNAGGIQTDHEPFRYADSLDTGCLLLIGLRLLRTARCHLYQKHTYKSGVLLGLGLCDYGYPPVLSGHAGQQHQFSTEFRDVSVRNLRAICRFISSGDFNECLCLLTG